MKNLKLKSLSLIHTINGFTEWRGETSLEDVGETSGSHKYVILKWGMGKFFIGINERQLLAEADIQYLADCAVPSLTELIKGLEWEVEDLFEV